MVQFAVQKKYTKQKKNKVSLKKWKKTKINTPKIPAVFFWVLFFGLLSIYWIFLLLKYTIFVPEYRIHQIDYAQSSVDIYDDPYLYKTISSLIKWENVYILSWNFSEILSSVQERYPFVQDIIIVYKQPNTVLVKLLFDSPDLVLRHNGSKFGVYKETLFELFSGNTLGSGTIWLDVLSFSSGSYLTWIFYQQSAKKTLDDVLMIKQWLTGIASISYLPWAHRMIVYLGNGQKVYVNNAIDIQPQIANYQLLKKYYSDFNLLKEIDLWSLEKDKVIVRK